MTVSSLGAPFGSCLQGAGVTPWFCLPSPGLSKTCVLASLRHRFCPPCCLLNLAQGNRFRMNCVTSHCELHLQGVVLAFLSARLPDDSAPTRNKVSCHVFSAHHRGHSFMSEAPDALSLTPDSALAPQSPFHSPTPPHIACPWATTRRVPLDAMSHPPPGGSADSPPETGAGPVDQCK